MPKAVLADDSMIVRDRVKAYLILAGYDVVGMGKNGLEGYELCAKYRPDVAIFDVSMPVMNGDVAAIKVKAEKLARHVIVASSQIQDATLGPVLEAGCYTIAKPFYQEKFILNLRDIVSKP